MVVDVVGALPAEQRRRPGRDAGVGRGQGRGRGRPARPDVAPDDAAARPGEGPALRGARAGRVAGHGRRLAAGGLEYAGEVLVKDGLGVLVGRRGQQGQLSGDGGSGGGELLVVSLLLLVSPTTVVTQEGFFDSGLSPSDQTGSGAGQVLAGRTIVIAMFFLHYYYSSAAIFRFNLTL